MKGISVSLVAIAMLLGPPAAGVAEEKSCRGLIRSKTLDNVKVPAGATCTLRAVRVKGTVTVGRSARLEAIRVRVIGNIQAENARNVIVRAGSKVGGSIQVVQGGKARVKGTRVGGDILFDDQGRALLARRNVVGGNLQAFQNSGGITIKGNKIDGNLQCKENKPAPRGGNNRVQGSKEDQCSRL
ncbi:MAG: hypothetical protein M3454_10580 [Actinomycetota bacterium]|nr:hypothetical protein [Actinomycetota bacterium]